jgi:hypothetical protein
VRHGVTKVLLRNVMIGNACGWGVRGCRKGRPIAAGDPEPRVLPPPPASWWAPGHGWMVERDVPPH